jgi:recombination protein RecR|tara:strand:+ start:4492 stop:5091 length:600 start_codon:yes stop_codon:yes gene_type:complete
MINSEIDHLVRLISKLPGLGLRSARRIVLHLLNNKEKEMLVLSDEIKDVAERVKFCVICGNMDTSEECYICKDEKRDVSTICVVENVGDLWAIERSGVFSGKYHVLGGVLSALDNIGPDDLKIGQLVQRAKSEKIKEVILANSATVDGQTTAHYIADQLSSTDIILSRLAQGLPMGGELDFLDDGTITQALRARSKLQN